MSDQVSERMVTAHPQQVRWPTLDHMAVAIERWEDAYPRFVRGLGGRWNHGGAAGDFAPYQLAFGDGMLLEFLSPHEPDGFVRRFLDRHGPAPHHLTFKVPNLEEASVDLARRSFDTFGPGRNIPVWRETFVHPRHSAINTLVQVVQTEEKTLRSYTTAPPDNFPPDIGPGRTVAMVGVTATDLERAHDLLGRALLGDVTEAGPGWFFATWGRGRSILVREPSAQPGQAQMWKRTPDGGVDFLLFGPPDLTADELGASTARARPLPPENTTGLPVWIL